MTALSTHRNNTNTDIYCVRTCSMQPVETTLEVHINTRSKSGCSAVCPKYFLRCAREALKAAGHYAQHCALRVSGFSLLFNCLRITLLLKHKDDKDSINNLLCYSS